MNSQYSDLIAKERLKIAAFRTEIEKCEKRISVLQSMDGDDELYEILVKKVGEDDEKKQHGHDEQQVDSVVHTPDAAIVQSVGIVSNSVSDGFPKRTLNDNTLKMLRFAKDTDQSVGEFFEFARMNGITQERSRVRNLLNLYKKNYGLLESDRDGYFRLSERGVAYLKSLGDDSSNEEGHTSAT